MPDPVGVLRESFGFREFREGQRKVIDYLLSGHSAAAVFPTGSGKSLCFQLPALLLPGLTLVVSPLIALMKDQIDSLKKRGIAAERLDSTLSQVQTRSVMESLRAKELRILYVAPERFKNERFLETIKRSKVSLFVIDEAHCISEWGHNFRPDYLKLARFAKKIGVERSLALTATATPQVLKDICSSLEIPFVNAVRTGFYRPNLKLLMTEVDPESRDEVLLSRLRMSAGPTIVYVTQQKTSEELAGRLKTSGFPARAYHAGMKDHERTSVQDWFIQSDDAIVVATIAFGMGIDKANIRAVYHYNLPKSLENYAQEIGRAGRDGDQSDCEMLVCLNDLEILEGFVRLDTPDLSALREFIDHIFSLGESFAVSYFELAKRYGIRPLVVSTLLTYLELDGYLEGGTPRYSLFKLRFKLPECEVVERFDEKRREFLSKVFSLGVRGTTWLHIDLEQIAQEAELDRERTVRALDYLSEQGWVELKAEGVRHVYRRVRAAEDPAALSEHLFQRVQDREKRDLARLHQVVEVASLPNCRTQYLACYFGENFPGECGHCSFCLR